MAMIFQVVRLRWELSFLVRNQEFQISFPESPPKTENSGVRKKIEKKERTVLDKTKNRAKLRTRCSAWSERLKIENRDLKKFRCSLKNWIVRMARVKFTGRSKLPWVLTRRTGWETGSKQREKSTDKLKSVTKGILYGEFDPGSERTLAAWIRHASRTVQQCTVAQGWGTRE